MAVVGHFRTTTSQAAAAPDYRAAVVADHLPLSLNPLVDSEDPAVAAITPLLYRCLLQLDSNATPVPDLASQVTISPDGLTYRLPLRSGLRWSDGSPITAQDALATIQWVQSPDFSDASYASTWRGVSASISGRTLVLTLASPRGSLAVRLTELPILPLGTMSAAQLAGLAAHASSPLPSSGPYQATGQRAGIVTLAVNPHASPAPHLARVQIEAVTSFSTAAEAFQAGTVEAVLAGTPAEQAQLMRRKGAIARDVLTFGFVDLLFNEQAPGLGDAAVRQAIGQVIDRGTIISGPLGGMGAAQYGPIPAGIGWLQVEQQAVPSDASSAEATLQAGGWVPAPGAAGSPVGALHLTLSVPDAAPLPAVAEMVAGQLDTVGLSVTVDVRPSATFLNQVLVPGSFQLAIAGWDAGADPDLTAFWSSTSTPPNGYNVSHGAADPFLDQDLTTLATVPDVVERTAAAQRVVQEMAQDEPAVFLYAPDQGLVVDGGSLSNVVVPAVGDPFAQAALWRS